MTPIQIHFHGPARLCSTTTDVLGECPHRDAPGIYLHAVQQLTGDYLVTYVGETTASFYRRTKEHVIQTLGGNYRVIDMDLARQGVERFLWDGLWRRGTRDRMPQFITRYEELAPVIKAHLQGHDVFVAPLDGEARLLRRIKGALAQQLRAFPAASNLLPEGIRYVVRRREEAAINIVISANDRVEGLPLELTIYRTWRPAQQ